MRTAPTMPALVTRAHAPRRRVRTEVVSLITCVLMPLFSWPNPWSAWASSVQPTGEASRSGQVSSPHNTPRTNDHAEPTPRQKAGRFLGGIKYARRVVVEDGQGIDHQEAGFDEVSEREAHRAGLEAVSECVCHCPTGANRR